MLWEVEIRPAPGQIDREAERVLGESHALGLDSIRQVHSARSFLIQVTPEQDPKDRQARSDVGPCDSDPFDRTFAGRDRSHSARPPASRPDVEQIASELLADPVVERFTVRLLSNGKPVGGDKASDVEAEEAGAGESSFAEPSELQPISVLFHPGVTDNVAQSTQLALADAG